MVIVDTLSPAVALLRGNFVNAQGRGFIPRGEKFDPERIFQKSAGQNRAELIYLNKDGTPNTHVEPVSFVPIITNVTHQCPEFVV